MQHDDIKNFLFRRKKNSEEKYIIVMAQHNFQFHSTYFDILIKFYLLSFSHLSSSVFIKRKELP
jgi:hypothetical protein